MGNRSKTGGLLPIPHLSPIPYYTIPYHTSYFLSPSSHQGVRGPTKGLESLTKPTPQLDHQTSFLVVFLLIFFRTPLLVEGGSGRQKENQKLRCGRAYEGTRVHNEVRATLNSTPTSFLVVFLLIFPSLRARRRGQRKTKS
jgi:hypothetical protein